MTEQRRIVKIALMERELSIPSEPAAIHQVEGFLTELARELGLDEDLTGDLIIAGTEAVNNAIYHGNRLQRELPVRVLARLKQLDDVSELSLSISDRGHDRFAEEHPAGESDLPESLLAESGRGMLIIRHLMDEVQVNHDESGTHVLLVKRIKLSGAA